MKYFQTPDFDIAINAKVGCSSVARAIILAHYPLIEQKIQSSHFPVGKTPENTQWQGLVPSVETPDKSTVLLVRDPVERFRSACAQVRVTAEDALTSLTTGITVQTVNGRNINATTNVHFSKQSGYLRESGTKCYLFPDHLEQFAAACGLTYPLPVINEAADKPVLTAEQEAEVSAYYANDITLYNNIQEAGQVFSSPPLHVTDDDRTAKLTELANARFEAETGGITLNGIAVRTDRESQAMLNGAYTTVRINPAATIDWKGASAWVTLDAAAITAIAAAVSAHVQACFTRERHLTEQILQATTINELNAIVY